MKVISFDSKTLRNLDQALRKEWLETNRFGGFAASSIVGVNTRRTHGLLVAQLKPPLGRMVFLSSLEEVLIVGETSYPLSTQLYGHTIYPEGYLNVSEFSLHPFPTWIYRIEDLLFQKSVVFLHEEQTVLIRYQILSGDEHLVRLELRPLTAFREAESLTYRNKRFNNKLEILPGRIELAGLFFYHNAAILDGAGSWYCKIQYPEEKRLGLEFEEDLYNPFCLVYTFQQGREAFLCASLEAKEFIDPERLVASEEDRRLRLLKEVQIRDPRFQILGYSTKSFFINPASRTGESSSSDACLMTHPGTKENSVRELLIGLHGLALTTGRYDAARNVLITLCRHLRKGLLPTDLNFNESEPREKSALDYGAMDLPLWLIHATFEYVQRTGDYQTVETVFLPCLSSIVEAFLNGTDFGIHVDSDGLVNGSQKGRALTWMNSTANQWAVTPRAGKPVEIQALWYNALLEMAALADRFGKISMKKTYEQHAKRAKESFHQLFWDSSLGYLYDVVDGDMKDTSLRPNQLLALGLPSPILEFDPRRWNSILAITRRHLLTPYGLRTLAPYESNYRPHEDGDPLNRKLAYHQGSVWTWFLTPYLTASLRMAKASGQGVLVEKVKEQFLDFLGPLIEHFGECGLGFVSETFDGDSPHEPRGTPIGILSLASVLELNGIVSSEEIVSEKVPTLTLDRTSI